MSKKRVLYNKSTMSLNDFKEYIVSEYKDKYTLDESSWVDWETPMRIHCDKHGWFYRKPKEFGEGFLCPYDSKMIKATPKWLPYSFEERAKIKFGDRFEYHLENYIDCKHEIEIVCRKHNHSFMITPDQHLLLNDGGCQKCASESAHNKFAKTTEKFISQSKSIWGADTFDYSNTVYYNRNEHITLICKKHNIKFEQTAYKHLRHHEQCTECLREANRERNLMQSKIFADRSSIVHNGRYKYDKADTKNRNERGQVEIYCPIHGYYWQDPQDHLAGRGCPKCAGLISKPEEEIKKFIINNLPNIEIQQGRYGIIGRKQLDLYIPSMSIAIEFNGLHWHTEGFGRDKHYHLSKLEECNKKDIQLMQIFEDEWIEHKEIVLSKIAHLLHFNHNEKTIRGHKCEIKEISKLIAEPFFNENHIQGYGNGSIILGAFFENELIGACVFKKEKADGYWELTRMATKTTYLCHGVCGKLFKTFVNKYKPIEIKSFADRRWTLNNKSNLYTSLGFVLDKTLQPDYRYVIGNKRIHKFNCRKERLHKQFNLPMTMTESEMTKELGFDKIWDCGLFKYIWRV